MDKFRFAAPQQQDSPDSPVFGAIFVAIGAGLCALALDWIQLPDDAFMAPRFIVLCLGVVFAAAGVLVAARARMPGRLGGLLVASILTLFAIISSWVAWGPGPREFEVEGFWFPSLLGLDDEAAGRLVFGFSAVIMWLFSAIAWYKWLTRAA